MTLLALFLLAQATPTPSKPDRVVVVARPDAHESGLQKVKEGVARAFRRLYEKSDPTVDRGNSLAAEGDPNGALQAYDEAQKKLGEAPELSYDRSTALVKKDPESAPEAAGEAQKALEHGDAPLKAKAAYQLGVAQEAMGKPEDAMKSYASALALNPNDQDAKVNLELLLKTKEERKQKQPQAQEKPDKDKQEKRDKGSESKGGEDKGKQDKEQAGKDKKEEQPKNQPGQAASAQQPKPDEQKKEEQQAAAEKPVDRSEAERLLDALRASEKNLQSWRFAKDKRKNVPRSDAEKDW
ncbi:MAG TPA: tetratricopeptide repeat protein [Myxococcales bacterium]|jgi:Ca-activated chloride channel family protein